MPAVLLGRVVCCHGTRADLWWCIKQWRCNRPAAPGWCCVSGRRPGVWRRAAVPWWWRRCGRRCCGDLMRLADRASIVRCYAVVTDVMSVVTDIFRYKTKHPHTREPLLQSGHRPGHSTHALLFCYLSTVVRLLVWGVNLQQLLLPHASDFAGHNTETTSLRDTYTFDPPAFALL